MFEWRNTGSGGYLINYYNILISDYDVSRAMVTINFGKDTIDFNVSLNGNICNAGDIYYYTLGTSLKFVAIIDDTLIDAYWFIDWYVNGENISSQQHGDIPEFSLLINNNMTYNVTVGFTVTSAPHPNPNPDLWG